MRSDPYYSDHRVTVVYDVTGIGHAIQRVMPGGVYWFDPNKIDPRYRGPATQYRGATIFL